VAREVRVSLAQLAPQVHRAIRGVRELLESPGLKDQPGLRVLQVRPDLRERLAPLDHRAIKGPLASQGPPVHKVLPVSME
jgi:hypothetical protein